tara:strand:+ start:906 stop:1052 length:147 start_codon:yes stop_codon:yes gene_type:complete
MTNKKLSKKSQQMESMLIVILLLISIVSFGFYSEYNKITGNAVNEKGG